MQNARLDEAQAGIKIAGRSINNISHLLSWIYPLSLPYISVRNRNWISCISLLHGSLVVDGWFSSFNILLSN